MKNLLSLLAVVGMITPMASNISKLSTSANTTNVSAKSKTASAPAPTIDYITGNDYNFKVYLGNNSISVLSTDFAGKKPVADITTDLSNGGFQPGTISTSVLNKTISEAEGDPVDFMAFANAKGTAGESVNVTNLVINWNSAQKIA